jgi:hypothetical protein
MMTAGHQSLGETLQKIAPAIKVMGQVWRIVSVNKP